MGEPSPPCPAERRERESAGGGQTPQIARSVVAVGDGVRRQSHA